MFLVPKVPSNTSWQKDFASSLKNFTEIKEFFELDYDLNSNFSCLIPQKFARKIKEQGPQSALWKQFIPTEEELASEGRVDPIGDKKHAKGGGIIHRYSNRLLFTPTDNCPIICRYCFRKNELSHKDDIFKKSLKKLKAYLKEHTIVNEVILTGGDPLILSNQKIQEILDLLIECNIDYIRFHTRTPIILPNRIDKDFLNMLAFYSKRFKAIIFVLHTNHETELSTDVCQKLKLLSALPIKCLSQTVLLKNINDTVFELKNLFMKLSELHFSPYYLHHPDKAKGAMHFTLSLEEGRRVYAKLHNLIPGWAIPHYIIDNFDGRGKQLAFNPESIEFSGKMLDKDGILTDY